MKTIRWTALFLVMASFAAAQAHYQYVVTTTVKPGMEAQYETLVKQVAEAAKKNGNAQNWFAFQITAGDSAGQYGIVLAHETWADKDSWGTPASLLTEAFGEDEAMKMMRAGRIGIASQTSTTASLVKALSTQLERNPRIRKYYEVTTSPVHPHLVADYMYGVQKIREAEAKASGAPQRITRRGVHGDRNTFTTATGYDSGADRDKWPAFADYMSAAYSETEIRAILEKVTAASMGRSSVEVMYRPDLSHPPAAATTSN